MTRRLQAFRIVVVLALIASVFCQGTLVLAGTTGTLSGTVSDSTTHQPIAGAKVTATSPSQSASAFTDGSGHYAFLALAPDTYAVSVTIAGYDTPTLSGETVIADSNRTLNISPNKALQTIGKVTSRTSTDLVKPGTTADVYSINAAQQDKSSGIGGGGNLNSAYSALASVPGVFVTPGQGGYIGATATLSIRGGDYDQIGYEIDGVPVNRAFDKYPSGTASSLGQQELQVYTGAAPANAEGQGLSGFINQVIKTGTYPASSTITGDIGGPTYYHKFSAETGGASPSRNFSYYVGLGGYNQDFRYLDNFNGASVGQLYGIPLAPCDATTLTPALAPSCYTAGQYNGNTGTGSYVLGPPGTFSQSSIADRDSVFNVHFGFPHKNGTKDDLQLLAVINHLSTQFYDSTNDQGGAALTSAIYGGVPSYSDGYQYAGSTGVPLPTNYQALMSRYFFPNSGVRDPGSAIPVNLRDGISNDQNILKLQYTHALGANALFKIYGYTYYSDWLQNGPQTAFANYYGPSGPNYELSSHTRGVSGTFTDQIGSKNLLNFQASYTTANTLRDNNTQMLNGGGLGRRSIFGALVDSSDPTSGFCYLPGGAATTCAPTNGNPALVTLGQAFAGGIPAATGTCGGGPCEYLVVGNGLFATYNTVKPKFTALSLTDQFKPTSKLTIDAGIRFDRFAYQLADTSGGLARQFFYNSFNLDNCIGNVGGALSARAPGAACPSGTHAANITNPVGAITNAYNVYQPRFGFTYSLDQTTVLRGSYGRFAEAPESAFQQYNTLQPDAPNQLYTQYKFQTLGFLQPDHIVVPPTSNNLDFSIEHQFGRDTALKVSPFLRKTQNQIQNFFLNQATQFTSGLNVGNQTSEGVEVELDKGDFGRNGFAGKLSLAYTNSFIKYSNLPNGTTVVDPINTQIKAYNAYTSTCAAHPTLKACAGAKTSSGVAAPCYTADGTADFACAATSIANPYWNAPVQGLLEPTGNYPTFDYFPGGIGTAVTGYGAPYTATFLLQYKHDRLAITPAVQLFAGQRYGAPTTSFGVSPDTCTAPLGSAAAGDPRYTYGAVGGAGFEYSSCGLLPGGIPDPYTRKFDAIGAFVQPTQLQMHVQIAYDISKRVSLVVNLANVINTCFGGSKTGFTVKGACYYGLVGSGLAGGGDVGNLYNPGAVIQPYVNTPYEPFIGQASSDSSGQLKVPFGVFVSARVKL